MTGTPFVNSFFRYAHKCTVFFLGLLRLRCADLDPVTMWVLHTTTTFGVNKKGVEKKRSRSYSELTKPIRKKRSSLMIDLDTFITTLYVMVDDFCQSKDEPERPKPGPQASLSRSEVITLALFGQWVQF